MKNGEPLANKEGEAHPANAARHSDMPRNLSLGEIVSQLSKSQREKLISGYDFKNFAKIFEDNEMMRTADAFLNNGMNVSRAARVLFMHRNTLLYRLNVIKRLTGLDLRNFDMALTFKTLHILYNLK